MTIEPPGFFDEEPTTYRRQLEDALAAQLDTVHGHASGRQPAAPWDFEAALVAVRHIADELRRLTLDRGDIPF